MSICRSTAKGKRPFAGLLSFWILVTTLTVGTETSILAALGMGQ
jgi:hypothetical protein